MASKWLSVYEKLERGMRLTAREYRAWKRWNGRDRRLNRWYERRQR